MMVWNNFQEAATSPHVVPKMDMVARMPQKCDLDSFVRGIEALATTLIRSGLSAIETHEPGPKTLQLVKKAMLGKCFIKKLEDGSCLMTDSTGETYRIVVIHLIFKQESSGA